LRSEEINKISIGLWLCYVCLLGVITMGVVRGDLVEWVDGVAIMPKKGEWVSQLASLRGKVRRDGFGVRVFDEGDQLRLVKVPIGGVGRPKKESV
jgi:hypothetical protein